MKKIILLLAIALIGPVTLIGSIRGQIDALDPSGAVIKYEGRYIVLEKGLPKTDGKLFIPYRNETDDIVRWYETYGRDSCLVYIVKDTLLAVSEQTKKIFARQEISLEIYKLWLSPGKQVKKELCHGQKYNNFLAESYVICDNVNVYYDVDNHKIIGTYLPGTKTRFPWENALLFFSLFIIAISVRNICKNYSIVSLPLIFLIYLLTNLIFLEYLCIRFEQVNGSILGILVIGMLALVFCYNKWQISMRYKKIRRRSLIGFAIISAGGIIFGAILWIALGYWQFMALSLLAGYLGYFFPMLKGKYRPLKNFILKFPDEAEE